jgi:hypothetical protein
MSMLPERVLLYGKDEALPERRALRAGPVALTWEGGDLRTVKVGGREVLRRVYVAIRDRNWGTVPNEISNLTMDVRPDSFEITFDAANRAGEIDFTWRGRVTGTADGMVRYTLDGVANSTFMKNRIGFCVLHPQEAAGSRCRIEHADGTAEEAELPVYIRADQPVQPFADIGALAHQVDDGLWAEVRFAGDLFEMEDQRNWTDASYKIFSTPLRLPYPAEVQAGTRISQNIELRVQDGRKAPAAAEGPGAGLSFGPVAGAAARPLPPIGLGVASHGQPLTAQEVERLRLLHLGHLRVDLRPADEGMESVLRRATEEAHALGVPLEMAVFLHETPQALQAQLERLRAAFVAVQPPVSAWLVYPAREVFWGGSPTAEIVAAARPVLTALAPDAPFASGTDADFIFLQRNLPPLDLVDALAYSITPQVHAFDNLSLVETLGCQAATVASAARLGEGRPVFVSPVTLKLRHNPYATAAEPPTPPGQLPPPVDPRQLSLFGAGWTLGSVKYLAESGAARVTFFETTGWRGVMESAAGSSAPAKFPSLPGAVFPLYHVLADAGAFAGGEVIPARSSDPLAVDGMVLRKGGDLLALVANLTSEAQTVTLYGLPGNVEVRVLDAAAAEDAMRAPETFRAVPGAPQRTADGRLDLALPPYAVARVAGSSG